MMYNGKMFWDGKTPYIQQRELLLKFLSQFPDDSWFDITVHKVGAGNTEQSKLYHKWCDIIHREYGFDSRTEVHEYFKGVFNNGESTKNFDTKQWSEYMLKVQAFANSNDINLPTGNLET